MDLYNIKSLQNVSQAADSNSNDLLNKGYATLHNIESMDASIQMLHGRITTMVIGQSSGRKAKHGHKQC
tara:strand:- start:31 stop:237 length:207 start_codon:yes stop_codon:yes gene_type:complete